MKRFWVYQRERFPLISHGLLIAAFSASAIAFSAFARHAALPHWWLLAAGFLSSLFFFLQMRIADEWKDAAEDAEFRPYRPVPRGLVSLRELAWVGVAAGVAQFAIALAISEIGVHKLRRAAVHDQLAGAHINLHLHGLRALQIDGSGISLDVSRAFRTDVACRAQ